MEASGRILLSRLSQAAAKRSRQTDIVCSLVDKYKDYGIIIAGDFNDTPISNTYQRISKTMKCAFRDSGNGVGISFSLKGFPVRIDHIFVSKEMKTSSTIVDNKIESSDHHPIITHISNYAK
jgi:endonuclease/exonuclease/phosphatase family metal-dependent hydrolase